MWDWVYRIIGKKISSKLNLVDGKPMDNSKPWYQSKTIWSDILTIAVGLYQSIGTTLAPSLGWHLPPIPIWIFSILGAIGIQGRMTANKEISMLGTPPANTGIPPS